MMTNICHEMHCLFNSMPRLSFPYNEKLIPENGIYVLFENGESAHSVDRIVRIGTHTGDGQLKSRIKQHFANQNKDRSIFRKNIGRSILNSENDPYLQIWEIDFTKRETKDKYGDLIRPEYQNSVENRVSQYMQNKFSFCVFKVNDKEQRLKIESKLISTIFRCAECGPSQTWLGLNSPKQKIRESGLWLVNELNNEPLSEKEYEELKMTVEEGY